MGPESCWENQTVVRHLYRPAELKEEVQELLELSLNPDAFHDVNRRRNDIRKLLMGRVVPAHRVLHWSNSEKEGLRQLMVPGPMMQQILKDLAQIDANLKVYSVYKYEDHG